MRVFFTAIILVVCFLAIPSCTGQPDNRSADEAAIRQADIAWARDCATGDVEKYLSNFMDGGVVLAPNAPIAVGKDAIRKIMGGFFSAPGFTIQWEPIAAEVARSGDIGYSRGTYQLSMNDAKGNPVTDRGKYATVWKKQADGSWKVALDMFNSDMPEAQPPSNKE